MIRSCHHGEARSGIALIMVLIVIVVLSVIAGGFAYSMKVETRLALNASFEADMEWTGRSGVELARYLLGQQLTVINEPYDALNQVWAGGMGNTNSLLSGVPLENVYLDDVHVIRKVSIVDAERKFNINAADENVIQRALSIVGVDAGEFPTITDSILDWRDADDDPRLSGAESDYYAAQTPPYVSKNGPLDDLSELMLLRGIRDMPEIYYGPGSTNLPAPLQMAGAARPLPVGRQGALVETNYSVGLVDIFNTVGLRTLNINTASLVTLQMIPEVDAGIASGIIARRSGPDGVEGTEDDEPFQSVNELVNVPGMLPQIVSQMGRYCHVRSRTFQVTVDVEVGGLRRQYVALLLRADQRNVQLLHLYWK